jgi:hypothetical protein
MAGDPICFPREIVDLEVDLPFKDAVYCGYNREKATLQNIDIEIGEEDSPIDVIQRVIDRPKSEINGAEEIPFILISTERETVGQKQLLDVITEHFGNSVYVKTFNSGKHEGNENSLASFFKPEMLTKEICKKGACVLISQGCCAAGITMKPELGAQCRASYDGTDYEIFGITDQILSIKSTNSAQTLMQRLRLFGWYPRGHNSTLWVLNHDHVLAFQSDLIRIDNQFRQKYDGGVGPVSVKQILTHSKVIKRICGGTSEDDPYGSDGHRYGFHYEVVHAKPEGDGFIELETQIVWSKISATWDGRLLRDLFKQQSDQNALRAELLKGIGPARIHAPYNETREKELFQACVAPKMQTDKNRYQVDGLVWGRHGINTPIVELYIILFIDNWKERVDKGLTYFEYPEDAEPKPINVGKAFYFSDGAGSYIVIGQNKMNTLIHVDDYYSILSGETELTEEHDKIRDAVEHFDEDDGGGKVIGKCGLCGAPGVKRTTCPKNPDAKHPNPVKHRIGKLTLKVSP